MISQDDEFMGIDKGSGFSLRVLVLSLPTGLIFLILGLVGIMEPFLALSSYVCVLFFNTVFLLPISADLQRLKKYIRNLATGGEEEDLGALNEIETRELSEVLNSMHKFWTDKAEMFENRTLSDAAVLDTLPDPLLIINKTGAVIGANLAARTLFKADLTEKQISAFIKEDKFISALETVLNTDNSDSSFNLTLTTFANKPKFYVRITRLFRFSKDDTVAVVSLYDLNKVLQFEQMQQEFVANASHELRTPLSIISGFVETLQTTAKDDEKARDKFLKIMQEQAVYMSNLIENLLSLSKIELSMDTPPEEKVNLNAAVREMKTALELKLKENNLALETHFARLPSIIADERQVRQVLQNLTDNAVKYAKKGTTVSITTRRAENIPPHKYYDVAEGEAAEISISNYGVTIAEADLERLTERFYRLQEHKNKNIKGTGLGLSIASQIIRRHKGNLIITSKDGITTFTIYLPLFAK